MSDQLMAYFGYGSLVNRRTLMRDVVAIIPARLSGWRRHWQARSSGFEAADGDASGKPHNHEIALLSIHQHQSSIIDGALVIDYLDNLALLDERERHYSRVHLPENGLEFDPAHLDVMLDGLPINRNALHEAISNAFAYVGDHPAEGDRATVLLQSYLDVVLSGFHDMHGDGAMERFIASTTGFDRDLLADRQTPVYPRHVSVPASVADRHDQLLLQAGVRVQIT